MSIGEREILLFIEGKLSQEQGALVQKWIAYSDANRKEFEFLQAIYEETNQLAEFQILNVNDAWDEFNTLTPELGKIVTQESRPRILTFPRLAATAVLIVLAGVFFSRSYNPLITINSGDTELVFELPDLSDIKLGPNSSLTYRKKFNDTERRFVKLKGFAEFDIEKDPNRPFIIKANQTITEVLGTSFKINSNLNETEIEVISGELSFYLEDKPEEKLLLQTGDKASFVGGVIEKYIEPEREPEPEPVVLEKPVAKPKPPVKKEVAPAPTPKPAEPKEEVNPYGNQSKYRLENVVDLLKQRFGKKFKKQKKCKISKDDTVLINLNGDMDFILEQLRLEYNIEIEAGKCDDCIELKSISKK